MIHASTYTSLVTDVYVHKLVQFTKENQGTVLRHVAHACKQRRSGGRWLLQSSQMMHWPLITWTDSLNVGKEIKNKWSRQGCAMTFEMRLFLSRSGIGTQIVFLICSSFLQLEAMEWICLLCDTTTAEIKMTIFHCLGESEKAPSPPSCLLGSCLRFHRAVASRPWRNKKNAKNKLWHLSVGYSYHIAIANCALAILGPLWSEFVFLFISQTMRHIKLFHCTEAWVWTFNCKGDCWSSLKTRKEWACSFKV